MEKSKGLALLLGMPSRGSPKGKSGDTEQEPEDDDVASPELVTAIAELRTAFSGDATDEEAADAFRRAVELC